MLLQLEVSRSAISPGTVIASVRHRGKLRAAAEWKGERLDLSTFGPDGSTNLRLDSVQAGRRPVRTDHGIELGASAVCGQVGFLVALALDEMGAETIADVGEGGEAEAAGGVA